MCSHSEKISTDSFIFHEFSSFTGIVFTTSQSTEITTLIIGLLESKRISNGFLPIQTCHQSVKVDEILIHAVSFDGLSQGVFFISHQSVDPDQVSVEYFQIVLSQFLSKESISGAALIPE